MTCIVLFITLRILQEYGQPGKVDDTKGGQKNASLYSTRTNIRTFYALNSGKLRGMYPDGYQMCDSSDAQTSMRVSTKKIILPKKNISVNTLIQGYKQYISMISYSGRVLMNTIQCFFAQTRGRIAKLYQKVLPEPHGDLAFWVVFGYEPTSSSTLHSALKQLGVGHLLVASGYQALCVSGVFQRFLSRKRSLMLLVGRTAPLWMYAWIAGAQPSILRAVLSRTFVEYAHFFGRKVRHIWVLFLSGAVFLIWNPRIIENAGFQFSFLISFGFSIFSSRKRSISSNISAAILAWFISFPLVLHYQHSVFLSSILNNLALMWMLPVLFSSSILILFLAWIPGLEHLISVPFMITSTVFLEVTEYLQILHRYISLEITSSFWIYVFWCLIFFAMLIKRLFQRKKRQFYSFL